MGMSRQRTLRLVVVGVSSLVAATLAVGVLESRLGVPDASSIYLLAVLATSIVGGTPGAILSAFAAFLVYDFLFVQPLYTFSIEDVGEWLNLLVLLAVGVVVGQLAAVMRTRADLAVAREGEARTLFRISRELATRRTTAAVLATIAEILRTDAAMDRVWVSLGPDDARERIAADTDPGGPRPAIATHWVLQRMPGDTPARWVRIHPPSGPRERQPRRPEVFRVRVDDRGDVLGSIWTMRPRDLGVPDPAETRLLSAAADQVGQALRQDRLAAEAQAAEIARQSDALKSALLQSVSHDLRTPLATIRAAAGTLRPGAGLDAADQDESVDAIDREVEYLNRLVTNLLDLSRIEAGALRAERDILDLDDLLARTIDRLRPRLAGRPLEVALASPPVEVDPVFLDEAVANVLENAVKYTSPGTPLRVGAAANGDGFVRMTIEDGGLGVPDESLPRLFEKFYRVPGVPTRSRSGTGIGLAVVRGLVEAMGGRVAARRSELGGLAIDLDLPAVAVADTAPAPVAVEPAR